MARSLKEILDELNAAEKEYEEKCKKYGIEEKHKRKKKEEIQLDENGQPIVMQDATVEQIQDDSLISVEQEVDSSQENNEKIYG